MTCSYRQMSPGIKIIKPHKRQGGQSLLLYIILDIVIISYCCSPETETNNELK